MKRYYHDGDGIIREVKSKSKKILNALYNIFLIGLLLITYGVVTAFGFQIDFWFGVGYIMLSVISIISWCASAKR